MRFFLVVAGFWFIGCVNLNSLSSKDGGSDAAGDGHVATLDGANDHTDLAVPGCPPGYSCIAEDMTVLEDLAVAPDLAPVTDSSVSPDLGYACLTPGEHRTVACGGCGTETDTCSVLGQWTLGTCTGNNLCQEGVCIGTEGVGCGDINDPPCAAGYSCSSNVFCGTCCMRNCTS